MKCRIEIRVVENSNTTTRVLGEYYTTKELPFKPTMDDVFFVNDIFIHPKNVYYDIEQEVFVISAKDKAINVGAYAGTIGTFLNWTRVGDE